MDKEKKIDAYIISAENYIRSHPDTTGTTNAMIALTISIQQVENQAKQSFLFRRIFGGARKEENVKSILLGGERSEQRQGWLP